MRRACVSRSGHCSLIFSLRLMMIITSEDMSYCFPHKFTLFNSDGDPGNPVMVVGRGPQRVLALPPREENVLRSRFGEK